MKRYTNLLYLFFFSLVFLSCRKEEDVLLTVDFSYEVVGNSYTIPAHISFTNKTTGAQFYKWSFQGGSPATYDKRDPGQIDFTQPGTIKVKLEAWNDAERKEKEIIIQIDSVVHAGFKLEPVINNFGPTDVAITNTSTGSTEFTWLFEGGTPQQATGKTPANVHYTNPGTYKIKLEAKNSRGVKDTVSKMITILPALSAAFDIVPSFDDEDYQAPLVAALKNNTISAGSHQWQTTGGTINNAADSLPTISFANPGTYTISYTASNGKQTQTVNKTITVLPNTRLRSFTNIQLGINTAHSTIGSFFSTRSRKVYKASEVTTANGGQIDLVYFGLNESFTYNLFASPDSAKAWTFTTIPNATATKFINSQESCGCGTAFTPSDFDQVTDGNAFNTVPVMVTTGGQKSFDKTVIPRVVLFENAGGKKGAIKIINYVNNGQQSYIVCDIKVQKD